MKGSSTSGSRIARKFQSSSTQDEEMSLNIIGTVFKLKSSATIKDLKTMLCNKYGFPENHLEFFLAGQPLLDFQRVVDCGFLECAVDLVFKNIVGMKLFVKLPSSTIEIEGKAEDTIQKVKAMIQAKEKIQPDQYTLVYDGKFLEEDMTLASLRMKNESTLHIIFNPRDVMSVFVKTPGGKIVEFEVKVLYTVSDVKQIVESFIGCSVVHYSLFYEGNELQDFKTLAFYNIKENSTLEVKPSGIQIFVKTWSGKTITLDVTRSNTVREVKEKIFCKVRVPVIRQRIVFSGKRLEDKCSLASYNIQKQSTLYMV
ncbi:putative ubiquitin [Rosa chinensis]|uniref:Putative ubiquitin n=1 Tax=Rosa chinensis TaxID=74649 RepID=A0A2P6QR69_ROSCH|nr:polyubiquitin 11 [Rosa chinensis]PRQ36675.1 putative ubiquitin [Rosa chinensis]